MNTVKEISKVCKLCKTKMNFMFKANSCSLFKCANCGFVQVVKGTDVPEYLYDKKYFISNKYKDDKALEKEHLRRKKKIDKYCRQEDSVLDWGCATGEFVAYISERYHAEGCDISGDAIKLAKEKYKILQKKFQVVSDMQNITKKYDAICLWDVIEHISEPYEFLIQLKRKLKRKGYLFISTPNIEARFAKLLKDKWPFMTPPEHLSFFSRQSISKMAHILDLEIVEWESKGKWANVGFILYKFNRVSNHKIPNKVLWIFQNTFLSKWNIYVPTCDIQYVVLRNKEDEKHS